MQVKNLMSEELVTIDKDQNICDALRLMKKHKIWTHTTTHVYK